ncbi:hypothetical protein PAPHI01_0953 [Pancytospora philotis]|nr:hypothetical protein PAPHI01_0953 [Pancytospora philotis]
MGLLDLISNLGRRNTNVYGDFLDAYGRLKQLSDVQHNLGVLAACLREERLMGQNRCMLYVQAHGIDRALLRLHGTADVEEALVLIFEGAGPAYLDSEFAHAVWKHGSFARLMRVVCEQCAAHRVYNSSISRYVCLMLCAENADVDFSSLAAGLVRLLELEVYRTEFRELGFGPIIVKAANRLIKLMDPAAPDMVNLLCFYEDPAREGLLDYLELMPVRESQTSDRVEGTRAQLAFMLGLFKNVKALKFRLLLIKSSVAFAICPGYGDFIAACIVCDPATMAGLLSERIERSNWSAAGVYAELKDAGILAGKCEGDEDNSTAAAEASNQVVFAEPFGMVVDNCPPICAPDAIPAGPVAFAAMPTVCGFIKQCGAEKHRIYSFPLLGAIIDNKLDDPRIYYFLYKVDKKTFYSKFQGILEAVTDRRALLELIYEDIVG